MNIRTAADKLFVNFSSDARIMFAIGAASAVIQAGLIREVFAVVSGNELVIGVMLAVWLGATSAGSLLGGRKNVKSLPQNFLVFGMVVAGMAGMTGVRAVRLLLMPGEAITPLQFLLLLLVAEAPVALCGGYAFGKLVRRSVGAPVYRWEQVGALAGLAGLSIGVVLFAPNFLLVAVVMVPLVLLVRGGILRIVAAVLLVCFLLADKPTAAWKYPLPMTNITYAREGEVARATSGGEQITYVNGTLYTTGYATPLLEQAVHTPLGMHPHPRNVLVVNNSGHMAEARKYPGVNVRCIRTDRLIDDTCCLYGRLATVGQPGPFDAVILGCGMPDNIAASRFFTRGFYLQMRLLVGDSGVFSFTLPLQSDYAGGQDRVVRDIIVATLKSVFRFVKVLPGEGRTFTASNTDYPLPRSCSVSNDYFVTTILAALSPEKIREANVSPLRNEINTAVHPRLLFAVLDRYLQQYRVAWWMVVALPVVLVLLLLKFIRPSREAVSVGSSGFGVGVFAVAIIMLYQSVYGTVYAELSLLLLSLSVGFTVGCFVRKFPFSDAAIGVVIGGGMLALSLADTPPAPLFFIGNAAAGFLASAQFVTRKKAAPGTLYAADCAGGVLGMSLASILLVPLFGMPAVAAGLLLMKVGVEIVVVRLRGDTGCVSHRM